MLGAENLWTKSSKNCDSPCLVIGNVEAVTRCRLTYLTAVLGIEN